MRRRAISLERINEMLDEIADALPREIYAELNGGVTLQKGVKYHPEGKGNDLYILGEYHRDGMMGRYIVIYGGSFQALFGDDGEETMKKELEKTLKHELIHHIEGLAGEKDLERKDAAELAEYRAAADENGLN